MSTIEIKNVSKSYGKNKALDDVSLTLKKTAFTVCWAGTVQENPRC